jgi:hypothetical protein
MPRRGGIERSLAMQQPQRARSNGRILAAINRTRREPLQDRQIRQGVRAVSDSYRVVTSRECPWCTVVLRDDGIVSYHPKPGTIINYELATEVLRLGLQIAGGPWRSLVLMQDLARVNREARALFASEEFMQLCSQTALVVGSPVSRVIGNFFVGLNRPKYPYRIFDDPALAVAWLRGFADEPR